MRNSVKSLILRDNGGTIWKVSVSHNGPIKQLYTEKAEELYAPIAEDQVILSSFGARFKVKINREGRLVTYKIDDLE